MAEDFAWWREDPDAQRQGFGVILHLKKGNWVVARTLVGSPADSAGVKAGDILQSMAGNPIAHSLRHTKLNATIELLDGEANHSISFLRGKEKVDFKMRPTLLRDLFEADAAKNGGVVILSCVSCPSCYSRPSGAAQCSDCPTYNCTTG